MNVAAKAAATLDGMKYMSISSQFQPVFFWARNVSGANA
jgi:hypothetical protein